MPDLTDPERNPFDRIVRRILVVTVILFLGAALWAANEGWFS